MIKECIICEYRYDDFYITYEQALCKHLDYTLSEGKQLCFDFYNGEIY